MRLNRFARPSPTAILSASVLAYGFVHAGPAFAVVPKIVGVPVVENPTFDGTPNTMMYDVTVTVNSVGPDPGHIAMVGYAADEDYTTCSATTAWKWSHTQPFDTTDTRTWTLYNFQPGTIYHYKVQIGNGPMARTRCGILETPDAPTPTVPLELSYLNFTYAKSGAYETKYMLVETDDCGGSGTSSMGATDYLVVLDVDHESIVWYLDLEAMTGLRAASGSGFRYQPGPTAKSGRILIGVSRDQLYEWSFDGSTVNHFDFDTVGSCDGGIGAEGPCLHHDIFKSNDTGNTYAMTSVISPAISAGTPWGMRCGTDAKFIDDGYVVLDDSYAITDERYLIDAYGYDPLVDAGPHAEMLAMRPSACTGDTWSNILDDSDGIIDWTHTNSIAASKFGASEMIDVSLKEWDQILRFNAATGALVWRLSSHADYSDWDAVTTAPGVVGAANFMGQHDVHAVASNTLLMLDNQGDSGGARAIELHLDTGARTATIEKSWAMVNALGSQLDCETEGSAERVPGSTDDHVLALCANLRIAAELSDPTGNTGVPPLVISLPNGDRDEFCSTGGPDERDQIRGWHRAFPIANVGEF